MWIFKLLFMSPVRSRVMSIIDKKIEAAEALLARTRKTIEEEADKKKLEAEDKIVEDLTSFIK